MSKFLFSLVLQGIFNYLRHSMQFRLSLILDTYDLETNSTIALSTEINANKQFTKWKPQKVHFTKQESQAESWDTWKWQGTPTIKRELNIDIHLSRGTSLWQPIMGSISLSHNILLTAINTSLLKDIGSKLAWICHLLQRLDAPLIQSRLNLFGGG